MANQISGELPERPEGVSAIVQIQKFGQKKKGETVCLVSPFLVLDLSCLRNGE